MRDHREPSIRPTGDDMGADRAEQNRRETRDITRQMRKVGPGFIPGSDLVKRRAANAQARKSRKRNRG